MTLIILALTLHGVGDGQGWIRERLDKAFVSTSWASVFPQQRLHHVATSTLDHCMLLLKCTQTSWKRKCKLKLFRFESMWLRDNQCDDLVIDAWEPGECIRGLYPHDTFLNKCRDALTHWNKTTFGHVGRKISTLRKKLQVLENNGGPGVDMEEVHETKMGLNKMLMTKEDMWNQRSRNIG